MICYVVWFPGLAVCLPPAVRGDDETESPPPTGDPDPSGRQPGSRPQVQAAAGSPAS